MCEKLVFELLYYLDNQIFKRIGVMLENPCNISDKKDIMQADLFKKDRKMRLLVKKSICKSFIIFFHESI
jgi:hypothetical protein